MSGPVLMAVGDFARGLAELVPLAQGPRTGPFAEELSSIYGRIRPLFDLTEEAFRKEDVPTAEKVVIAHREIKLQLQGFTEKVAASDLNAKNFVIGHRHSNGNLGARECVLVDGFGDIHAIPMRSFSKWTNRIGLDDSRARLARNMKLYWDADTRQITKGKN